jgi:arachidonate 15-lipoxygenase
MVSAQHEVLGSFLWNYQLWTHRQPVRVYANGQREPLDVYQRLVNANYNLNVRRRLLMHDFSYLALDTEGGAEMKRFERKLQALQSRMERDPWAVWKLYPTALKVNINA